MDKISDLPKDILQRIIYFLSQKEAVQTSVLSKSWRYNCRPNLDFSFMDFDPENQTFISVVDRTLHRYCDKRLSVEEFDLCILTDNASLFWKEKPDYCKSVSLLEKWIPLLTNMGLKKFRLSIYSNEAYRQRLLQLPRVVLGAESLQHLHLEKFQLDRETIESMLLCKHLRSLCLKRVYIKDDILQKIISSNPLIETLDIHGCCQQKLHTLKLNDLHNLKYLSLDVVNSYSTVGEELRSIEIYPPSLETLYINILGCGIHFNKEADFHFHNLSVLYLCGVKSSLEHLSSCKFPRLKSLTLRGGDGLKEIHLFIDAPNITYFEYRGDIIPSISFATTTSSEWRSQIELVYWPRDCGSSCFLKLHELLKSLRQSEISLDINHYLESDRVLIQEINGCNKPVAVKNLSLDLSFYLSSISYFLDALFCVCRPRIIGDFTYNDDIWQIIECMWNILMQGESNGNKDDRYCRELWKRDFEEVRLEIKKKNGQEDQWRTITLSELPNYFRGWEQILARFALKWRQT